MRLNTATVTSRKLCRSALCIWVSCNNAQNSWHRQNSVCRLALSIFFNTLNLMKRNLKHCPRSTTLQRSRLLHPKIIETNIFASPWWRQQSNTALIDWLSLGSSRQEGYWQAREKQSASCTNGDERLRAPQQCHRKLACGQRLEHRREIQRAWYIHDVQGCSRPSGSAVHTTYSSWPTHQSKSSVQVQEHFNQLNSVQILLFSSYHPVMEQATSRDGQRSNTRLVQESPTLSCRAHQSIGAHWDITPIRRDIYLFFSLIHQQSYQTVAAKGIQHADGKARPTGTCSFPAEMGSNWITCNSIT